MLDVYFNFISRSTYDLFSWRKPYTYPMSLTAKVVLGAIFGALLCANSALALLSQGRVLLLRNTFVDCKREKN